MTFLFDEASNLTDPAFLIDSSSCLAQVVPLEAVLFDIDGTLCDSDPIHLLAFQGMLQEV